MPARVPQELGRGRIVVDLGFRDHDGLIASYLLPGPDGWTLVETGPTTCRTALLEGLGRAGVEPGDVVRVLVSHIHLDHAGGLGALADELPKASFYAHEAGVRHLLDPGRLIESARRAWGAAADPLWGTIVPVPPHRLSPLVGGERFPVAGGTLEVLATPGHAKHHVSFFDSATGALLSGDSAGVHVDGLWRARPAIPPPDLDLELLFGSLAAMALREPREIWYAHFGSRPGAVAALQRYRGTIEEWRDVALEAARDDPRVEHVATVLSAHEAERAAEAGAPAPSEDRGTLVSGYDLAAQGLVRYFSLHGLLPG